MAGSRSSQPTLADVARAARVSMATASRALNGTGPVSASARAEVLRAVAELSYVPNPLAVQLASRRGHRVVIGVIAVTAQQLTGQYVNRLVSAAAQEADEQGLGVSARWIRPGDLTPLVDAARDRGVNSLLLVNHDADLLDALPAGLRGRVAAIGPGFDRVASHDVDIRSALAASLSLLVEGGRRRIAMLTGPAWVPSLRQPVAVYRASMRAHGLPARTAVGGLDLESGVAGTWRLLRRWPDTDAIVSIMDITALGALRALSAAGRRVPDDVAVVGFDDVPSAALGQPALTTATHPVEQIAAGAVRCLLDGDATADRVVVHPSRLVRRQSA